MMKKYGFSLLMLFILFSCNNKNHANPSVRILGTWNGTHMYQMEYHNDTLIDRDTTFLTSPDFFIIEFRKDSTLDVNYSLQGISKHFPGFYQVTPNTLLIQSALLSVPEDDLYHYKLNGHNLELILMETNMQNNQIFKEEEHIFLKKQ